jgi:hypothetical protein
MAPHSISILDCRLPIEETSKRKIDDAKLASVTGSGPLNYLEILAAAAGIDWSPMTMISPR